MRWFRLSVLAVSVLFNAVNPGGAETVRSRENGRCEGPPQDGAVRTGDCYTDPRFPVNEQGSLRLSPRGLSIPIGTSALSEAEIVAYMQANTDGVVGIYLKEIGGSVLQAFNETTIFEPASTLKAAVHIHGMLEVQNGPATLTDDINWLADMAKFDGMGNYVCSALGGADCYADNTVPMVGDRDDTHRLMLECSDNANTQALRDVYGDPNIRDTMYNIVGMSMDSQLNHSIGCGADALATPNQLTLADLGLLYETAATGLLDGFHLGVFYDLLPDHDGVAGFFTTPIDEEAAARLLTASEIDDFKDLIRTAWKPGSYGLNQFVYISRGGWATVPFACEGIAKEYVFGHFVHQATTLDLQNTGQPLSLGIVAGEQFREEIGLALDSVVCDRPPLVSAPDTLQLECSTEGGVPKDDAAIQAWLASGSASDHCDGSLAVQTTALPDILPAGCPPGQTTNVTFSAEDSCGNADDEVSGIQVQDATPPEVGCQAAVDSLWPPNHKFEDVGFSFTFDDICAPDTVTTSISVTSDEATATESGSGGLNHCADAVVGPDGTVRLRAERSGNGDGRVYVVTVSATDACGNVASCTVNVSVPHNVNGPPAVDSGQAFDAMACQ